MHSAIVSPAASAASREGVPSVRNLPVNLFAAVMGLSGLALAWRLAHHLIGAPAFIGESIAALAVLTFLLISGGYLTKLVLYPAAVRAEFAHPVGGNFFGTIVISILLLSAVTAPYNTGASHAIWTVGVIATFLLSFVAVSRLLKGQLDAAHVGPAWIIPCVATLDIPVTGAHMAMAWAPEINLLASAIGTMMAIVLFALIFSRLIHREPMASAATPSLMILMAPFAVGFLAYTNIVSVDRFAALLFYFALFMFVVIAPKIFRRSTTFSAAWWAVGFPIAALVNAAIEYADFRASRPLWILAMTLLVLLTLLLAVLAVRTIVIALNGKLFA